MDGDTLAGTLLAGRYLVGAVLGRGGVAEVHEATDERLQRPVAVKTLLPHLAADPRMRRRFESEARAAARLSHPNVVSVFDTGEDGGVAYIVMERLPGETVADRIAAGPVDEAWLRLVAGDVLLAMGAAHRAGIVHRDVKPGNILLAVDGCAKVTDFGIAKTVESGRDGDLTATNMVLGTPAYLAPERIEGRPATPRSDLYSLGVVLYEALTGRKPFAGATPVAVARAAADGRVTPLDHLRPGVDATLAAVVARAMEPDPRRRFPSAEAMAGALDDGTPVRPTAAPASMPAAGAPTLVAEPTIVDPGCTDPTRGTGARAGRRRLVAAAVAGALLLALVSALAVTGRSAGGPSTPTTVTVPATAPPTTAAPSAEPTTTTTTAPTAPAGEGGRGRHDGRGPKGNGNGRSED